MCLRANVSNAFALAFYSYVAWLRHSYGAPSRLVSTAYCTWRWCFSYGPATVRFRAWCPLLTAPGFGAWDTTQLWCAFARSDDSLLHLVLVLRLRHSYGAPSRLVTTAYCTRLWCFGYGTATVRLSAWCLQLTRHGDGASATAHQHFANVRGNYSFLHLALVLGLRHSYDAPKRLVSTAYCTWRWCLGYGIATVRLRAWCLHLTAPGVGA